MEMNNRYEDHFVESKAFFENNNWKLNGSKSFVINGDSADKAQYVLEITARYLDQYGFTENSQLQLISI